MQLGSDNFSRVSGSGLGTASDGQAWSTIAGTTANYTVSATQGHYAYDSHIFSKVVLGYGVSQDFNFLGRFIPGSSSDFFGFYYRHVTANDCASAQINASGQYSATIFSSGVEYDYTGATVSVTAGTGAWLRVAITGTTIQMRYWLDGTTEPTSWGATFTDANTPWIGQYGLILRVGTVATSIIFDDFTATNNITTNLSSIGGYIFPGSTPVGGTSDVPTEIADGRRLDRLKPQYWATGDGVNGTAGVLIEDTVAFAGWDGYNSTNAALVKAHSTQQFVTVSGIEASGSPARTAISTLAGNSTLLTNFCNTLVTFCTQNGFTGIEMDFEHRGGWTSQATLFGQLKTIITALGNALHTAGLKLMVDGPAFTAQGAISWKWSDFNSLPVDYVCPLVYDNQYDTITVSSTAAGPDYAFSPVAWITNVITFMKTQISNINQIVIAVTSESYYINNNDVGDGLGSSSEDIGAFGYNDAAGWTGFSGATRDKLSGEMMWTNGGKTYVFCDQVTMNTRLQVCLANGIVNVDVWFLGSANKWFTVLPSSGSSGSGGGGTGIGVTLTNAGLNLIRDALSGANTPKITYVGLGTGTTAPSVNDTKLANEVFRKAVTSYTNGAKTGEIIILMYLSPGDAVNMGIQEFGFFAGNATSATNTGVLLARGLYNHTHLNTESIQFSLDFIA